ncbi:MAG: glycosyltransferase [Patescibacteria group bacterium]
MISIVIPAKNEERYILDCLRSIIGQNCLEKVEITVVDNNSTDNTHNLVLENFPSVKLVREPVAGTNSARQRGFLESRGEIIVFLDADVRLPEGWIAKMSAKLASSPKLVAVSGPYKFYDFTWYWNWGNEILLYAFVIPWSFISSNIFRTAGYLLGGSMVIRKQALERIGGFNTRLKFFGDEIDTAKRLRIFGRIEFCGDLWVYSSARRYNKKGVFATLLTYWLNYFWIIVTKHPYHKDTAQIVR